MPTRVRTSRAAIAHEISLKISRDNEPQIRTKAIALEVMRYWRDVAWPASAARGQWPDHPYETGDYANAFGIRRNRGGLGRFIAGWSVYNDDEKANFIENGTGPDKPGSRSPWGPFTPTPEFAPAAMTAHHFRGTAP